MKRYFAVLFLLFTTAAAQANPYGYPSQRGAYLPGGGAYPAPQQAPQAQTAPDQIVRRGINLLKGFLAGGGNADRARMNQFLDERIAPFFDFDYMAKWAAGPRYSSLSDQQKAAYSAKLRANFFSALARNLGSYSNVSPRIDVFAPRGKKSGEVRVSARVTPQNGYPLRLDFRFYRGDAGWKIFDVTANGTSAVVYYRKNFKKMVSRGRF